MTMPGFTAERSLRQVLRAGLLSTRLLKRNTNVVSGRVVPAYIVPPATFAECYEACVAEGGTPDDCFWLCILLFPLESGYDYAVFPEDVIAEDAVIDLTAEEAAAEAGAAFWGPLLGAVAIGLAIGIPAGFLLDWAITKPAGSGPTGTTGATPTSPPTCRITGGAIYTPPGPVTGCYFGSKRSIDQTIENEAQAVCNALPAGFCSGTCPSGAGTCKPIVIGETVLSQGWCMWGTSTTMSFQCGCRCW